MTGYSLPMTLEVGGKEYDIRTDFRAILDVLASQRDPDLDQQTRALVLLKIIYPKWNTIPQEHLEEAIKKAISFIDCGIEGDDRQKPQLVDWEQDAPMIVSAINRVAHTEVRQLQYLHWWTFFSYYMEIGEGLFSQVVSIRSKKAQHKKLEKYEQEFYRENKKLVDIHKPLSEEEQRQDDAMRAWFKKMEGGENRNG